MSVLQRRSAWAEPQGLVTAAIGSGEARRRTGMWALFIAAALTWQAGALPGDPLPDVPDPRAAPIFRPLAPPDPRVQIHRVTAYCSCPLCCGRWSDGITASGRHAVQGHTAAADTSIWSIGTCLDVPGVGPRVVEDTGLAMVGRRLDVYFESHEEALLFGIRFLPLTRC